MFITGKVKEVSSFYKNGKILYNICMEVHCKLIYKSKRGRRQRIKVIPPESKNMPLYMGRCSNTPVKEYIESKLLDQ